MESNSWLFADENGRNGLSRIFTRFIENHDAQKKPGKKPRPCLTRADGAAESQENDPDANAILAEPRSVKKTMAHQY